MDISIRGLALKWWTKQTEKDKDIFAISFYEQLGKRDKNKGDLTDFEIEEIYKNWLISE